MDWSDGTSQLLIGNEAFDITEEDITQILSRASLWNEVFYKSFILSVLRIKDCNHVKYTYSSAQLRYNLSRVSLMHSYNNTHVVQFMQGIYQTLRKIMKSAKVASSSSATNPKSSTTQADHQNTTTVPETVEDQLKQVDCV